MKNLLLRAVTALALMTTLSACDSLPGAFEPEGPARTATLRISNLQGSVIEIVEARPYTTDLPSRFSRVMIGRGDTWTANYAPGRYYIYMEFWGGSNTARDVELIEGQTVSIVLRE